MAVITIAAHAPRGGGCLLLLAAAAPALLRPVVVACLASRFVLSALPAVLLVDSARGAQFVASLTQRITNRGCRCWSGACSQCVGFCSCHCCLIC